MKHFRLKRIHVVAAGLVLAAGVSALFFFMYVKPLKAATDTVVKSTAGQQTIADQKATADRDLAAAKVASARTGREYKRIMDTRMPKFPYPSDGIASMIDMWSFNQREGALMDRWFRSTGAQVTGYGFQQGWGANLPDLNIAILPAQTWNLSVTVRDLNDLFRWLRLIPQAPRFMVLNSVAISGNRTPGQPLTAQVSVTLYEWVNGAGQAGAATTVATGATGGGGGGGGMGRGGGGGAGGGMGRGGGGGGGGGMGRGGGMGGGGGMGRGGGMGGGGGMGRGGGGGGMGRGG